MDNTNGFKKNTNSHNNNNNLKLLAVGALLVITPLVSTPLRLAYLYVIVNLLIIAVGADAGLLSFLLQSSSHNKKLPHPPALEENLSAGVARSNHKSTLSNNSNKPNESADMNLDKMKTVRDPSSSDKNNILEAVDDETNKSPSSLSTRPSIFFVGGNEKAIPNGDHIKEDQLLDVGDDWELFEKAEMFIGNFYRQLKMQIREDQSSRNELNSMLT